MAACDLGERSGTFPLRHAFCPCRNRQSSAGFEPSNRSPQMSKINLKHGLLVMVADGEKALFLKNEGDNLYPNLQLFQEMNQGNPATREQGSDSPGRYNDGPSVHR